MRTATGKRHGPLWGLCRVLPCLGHAAPERVSAAGLALGLAIGLAIGALVFGAQPSGAGPASAAGSSAGKAADTAAGAESPAGAAPAGTFEDFDDRAGYPGAEALRKLLLPVPGQALQIAEARKHERPICRMAGLARLAADWPAGHALRLGLSEANPFQVHLWNGTRGITLRYYPDFHQSWAAYAVGRQEGSPRPGDYVLLATTGDLYRRSGLGTIEVHHRDGRLYLVRGEVVLLDVPCPALPAEVYLEGTALIRGVAVVPAPTVPAQAQAWPRPRPSPASKNAPLAAWPWTKTPGEAHLDSLPEGGLEFWVEGKTPLAQAGVSLAGPGLWDMVFEVESPSPGTGLYLGTGEGRHLARVGFFRHRESGKVVFDLLPPWSNDIEKSYDANRVPVPFFGNRRWLRLVCGAGVVRLWTSPDGKAWSPIAPGSLGVDGPCTSVGLYALPGEAKRSIRLHTLEVGRLDALEKWADAAAEVFVPALRKADSLAAWRTLALESQPAGMPWEKWWRACAVRTLAENPRRTVSQAVLDRLVVAELQSPGPLAERLRLLDQAARLLSGEEWNAVDQLEQWADTLAAARMRAGQPAVFSEVSHALLELPFWHGRRVPVFSEAWLRHELFAATSAGRWAEVRALVQRLRYFGGGPLREGEPLWGPPLEYLLAWAEAAVSRQLGRAESTVPATPPRWPQRWGHPFIEPSQREAFNVLSEFRAAVDSQAWAEACQLVVAVSDPQSLGLHPDRNDPHWFLSFPLVVELAVRSQPALRQMMQEKFTAMGRLRLKQAVASSNAQAVLGVAHQFPGTEAAAEARRWLGDRELSAGRALEALAHYRRALSDAAPAERPGLLARMRLAAAMMGLDLGQPPERGVQLGGTWFSAAQFEAMVQKARASRRPARSPASTSLAVAFPPGQYEARALATFDGSAPRPAWIGQRLVDWFGQQLCVTPTPETMLVGTRAGLACLRLSDRQWLWNQWADLREDRHQAVLVPMPPLVVEKRGFVRRLSSEGPELACLDLTDGKVLWSVRPESYAASDPLVVGSQLLVLAASYEGAEKVSLWLARIRPASGRVRSRVWLADFRDGANPRVECQWVAADDLLVAAGAGVVLCCDTQGRVRWVRRQVWTPPPMKEYSVARAWFDHPPEPPLVAESKVFATQPGVWGVEAMDLESGRLLWRAPLGTLIRMVGVAQGRLVLQTTDGLVALDAETGRPVWDRATGPCCDVRLCGPQGPVVALLPPQRATRPPGLPVVQWFDLRTGRWLGQSTLTLPAVPPGRVEVWLRPLVLGASRQWVLLGTPRTATRREILELVRVGDIDPAASQDLAP